VFSQIRGFGEYGFPESHAASFALLVYVSSWLKCHHPDVFCAALLNSQPMGFYAPHSIIDDAKLHGVTVLPIDPEVSQWDCTLENKSIRLGFRNVYGLSKEEYFRIESSRPFRSLGHFLSAVRMKPQVLTRLILAKGLDRFGASPRNLLWSVLAENLKSKQEQGDLFSEDSYLENQEGLSFSAFNAFETVHNDYSALGLSSREHPMKALRRTKMVGTRKLPALTTRDVKNRKPKTWVETAGLLLVRQRPPTANGVCFAAIEDEWGFLDLVLFQKDFENNKEAFLNHGFLIVSGMIERDGHSVSLVVKKVKAIFQESNTPESSFRAEPTQYFW